MDQVLEHVMQGRAPGLEGQHLEEVVAVEGVAQLVEGGEDGLAELEGGAPLAPARRGGSRGWRSGRLGRRRGQGGRLGGGQ